MEGMPLNKQKQMVMVNIEMGVFCEELLEEILIHVPFKPLNRMMCVSKAWYHLISHLKLSKLCTPGLFVQYANHSLKRTIDNQAVFLEMTAKGREIDYIERDPLGFSLPPYWWFSSSSNGLLLCHSLRKLYVCNPTLNQWISLPPIPGFNYCGSMSSMGLAFNGLTPHYKVVCFSFDINSSNRGVMDCMIFSSETGKWRIRQARLLNSLFMRNGFYFSRDAPFLFHGGAVHWCSSNGHMLVYHLQKGFFKIKELPLKKLGYCSTGGQGSLCSSESLWEAGGCLHHGYVCEDGFHIWEYGRGIKDNNMMYNVDTIGKWHLKYKLYFKRMEQIGVGFGYYASNMMTDQFPAELKPCGFNDDLQVLYLCSYGYIYSYSFDTKSMKKLWPYKFEGSESSDFKVHPFVFNPSDLPLGSESILMVPEKKPSQITGRPLLLVD